MLRQSKRRLVLGAHMCSHGLPRNSRKWRKVRLLSRLKARRAQVRLWIFLVHYNYRLTKTAALVALPIRRPLLFLANLCAELSVLLLKLERYFLKLEKSRLKIRDEG